MASAAKAFRDWRRDEGRRRDLLRQSADALMAAADDIAPILTLECGTAWVNTHLALAPHQPVGGAKWRSRAAPTCRSRRRCRSELQVVHRSKA